MNNFLTASSFNLLHQSIRLDDPADALKETVKAIETNQIDWDELFVRADAHCIKPQLGILLNKINAHLVPLKFSVELKETNLDNLYLQLGNVSEFFQIKQSLDEVGVMAVPFKGFSLADSFYGNMANRESMDVDLFIDAKDLGKIKTIMAARGYIAEEPLAQLSTDYILKELCEYNFDQYDGDTRVFHFEFHWRIGLSVYGMDIGMDELKSQTKQGVIQNNNLTVFTASANFLLAVMHHGGKDQFLQLKQVLDIAYIINKQDDIDWDWVIIKAKQFKIETLVYIAIKMSSLLTGVSIPTLLKDHVNSKIIRRLTDNRIQMMAKSPVSWYGCRHNLLQLNFQIRSRSSSKLKTRLIIHELKKGILPQLIPKKLHHVFLNKKIRIKPVD